MHYVHKMPEASPKTIKLPHNKCVALSEGLQARSETWAVVPLARCGVAVEVTLLHAYGK
jgi:hypothetical protein